MEKKISNLIEVVQSYDALIFDIWGVLYDGISLYPDTINFLNQVLSLNKKVVFLSNTPRPGTIMQEKFISWGLDMNKVSIYTSGDAVREQLVAWNDEIFKSLGRKFYHVGEERNKDILNGLNVERTDNIQEANFLLITAYVEENENLNVYDSILKEAADLKLEAICPNPDLVAYQGKNIRYCAGTFSKKYEKLGGIVHYYGKPEARFFNSLIKKYLQNIDKSKMLMIGDTMETDILGANNVGIDTALVLTGNGQEVKEILEKTENFSNYYNYQPTWFTYGVKL